MKIRPESTDKSYAGFYKVIAPLVMCEGVGDGLTTACVMAQAATIDALRKGKTLDKPTDEMECACPVLRRMAINANDQKWWAIDADRTEHLRPLIPLLLDSRVSDATGWKRVWLIVDRVVRDLTPMRLEFIGRKEDMENIKALSALAPIVDVETCKAAREVCRGMKASASADASAYASADKLKVRSAYLQLFRDVAAIKD